MIERWHIQVWGRVQQVSFRDFTECMARLIGINGTAENKGEDCVEIFAEAEAEKVEKLAQCVTYGPTFARVDSILAEQVPVTGELGFSVIRPVVQEEPFPLMLGQTTCDICGEPTSLMSVRWKYDYVIREIFKLCPKCAERLKI